MNQDEESNLPENKNKQGLNNNNNVFFAIITILKFQN